MRTRCCTPALQLSRVIVCAGNGLFIGNSMPIRDMDMYATWKHVSSSQGIVADGSGCPVGSNRGASGIDGVLSTAAGFAAGLKRPVTLVVGDVSFLHDINGLNLLRTGWCRPPCKQLLLCTPTSCFRLYMSHLLSDYVEVM